MDVRCSVIAQALRTGVALALLTTFLGASVGGASDEDTVLGSAEDSCSYLQSVLSNWGEVVSLPLRCELESTPMPELPRDTVPRTLPRFPRVDIAAEEPEGGSTFRLCGEADPEIARTIEELIAGRGFSAALKSRGDGCADLTVSVGAQSAGQGRQSTSMSVSVGQGRRVSLQIVSENGQTRVSFGG